MNAKKKSYGLALLFGAALAAHPLSAETMFDWSSSGSLKVGATQSAKIPGSGEVYWKISGMTPGKAYTFVAAGSGADVEVVYTYSEDGDLLDSALAMGIDDVKTENQSRCIVTYDDWTLADIVIEDPEYKEFKVSPKGYFLHVSGDEGATITFTSMQGAVEEPIPVGDADNPKALTPGTLPSSYSAKLLDDGDYHFTVNASVPFFVTVTR